MSGLIAFGHVNQDAVAWAERLAVQPRGGHRWAAYNALFGQLSEHTTARMRHLVMAGIAKGATPQELAAQIIDGRLFDGRTALLIAETEIAMANSHGQLANYAGAGLGFKRWLLSNDPGACSCCADNAAQGWIPISSVFNSGAQAPLDHPCCRCCLTAIRAL